jgi:hypothetical protein
MIKPYYMGSGHRGGKEGKRKEDEREGQERLLLWCKACREIILSNAAWGAGKTCWN